MESLATYIPMDRRHALSRGESLPDRSMGAVLFADISGFTPITTILVRSLGPQRGAEEVTRQLNRVYDVLIAEVHRYHGSVVNFIGDAIICWFEQDQGQRAVTCALRMQQAMTQYAQLALPGGIDVEVAVKIAVASGQARRFVVGDPAIRQLDLLAGAILERTQAAEQLIRPGEVIAGAEIVERFAGDLQVKEWRSAEDGERFAVLANQQTPALPSPWPAHPPLAVEESRGWLLPAIFARLQQSREDYVAELRPVVAMFVKFSGIDYEQEDAEGSRLNSYIRWVQQVLARYGGSLLELTTGDKGSNLYAVFGAPVAYEDAPVRAANAALALRDMPPSVAALVRDVQIGISQGQMRTGMYGGALHRSYGVQGREVNVAIRLMTLAAPGQIILSDRIAAAAGAEFDLEPLGPRQLKGVQEARQVFALRSPITKTAQTTLKGRPLTAMIGRERERAILFDRLAQLSHYAQNGAGDYPCHTLILEGEAGIGKSRLISELQAQAHSMGITALSGAGDAIEYALTYFAWRKIFRQAVGFQENESPEELQQRLRTVFGDAAQLVERAPLLNAVLPLNLPDNALTAQMTGEVRAENTRDLLVQLLRNAQKRQSALLLILDDVQWLDSASWSLALAVTRHVPKLLLVLTTRPFTDETPAEYEQLLRAANSERLNLAFLSPAEVEALVCQRLGVDAAPVEVIRLITEKAEGHPFFSEELAYALRDAGLIAVEGGVCRLMTDVAEWQTLNFPSTIQGVITSRIDRLPAEQQLLLKIASVIGRLFAIRILQEIYPVERNQEEMLVSLDQLTRLAITQPAPPPPNLAYMFKHILTQEAAYNLLLFTQRQELHRTVAAWYEQAYAGDRAAVYAVLAHHWSLGQAPANAIVYLEAAGQQALRDFANQEAITFFHKALLLASELEAPHDISPLRRASWERSLGEAYLNLGRLAESRAHFRQALVLLERPAPTKTATLIIRALSEVAAQLFHRWRARAQPRSRRTSDAGPEQIRLTEAAAVYDQLSTVSFYAGEVLPAIHSSIYALNLAEKVTPGPEIADTLARSYANALGMFGGILHWDKLAEGYFELARQTAEEENRLPALAWAYQVHGVFYLQRGIWQPALTAYGKAKEIREQLGAHRGWEECIFSMSIIYYCTGDFEQCKTQAQTLVDSAKRRDDAQSQLWGLSMHALALLAQDQVSEALALLTTAERYCQGRTLDQEEITVRGLLALAHLRQGNRPCARVFAEQVVALLQKASLSNTGLNGHAGAGLVLLDHWQERAALSAAETKALAVQIEQVLASMKKSTHILSYCKPQTGLLQGIYLHGAGKQRQALRVWRQSLALAEQMAMPYDQGLLHAQIGKHLAAEDPQRHHHLARADELFAAVGANYDRRAVQTLLPTAVTGFGVMYSAEERRP
jgi:class 3 adenylate cyclase/tetratricopeptide (TPR) repeat protein